MRSDIPRINYILSKDRDDKSVIHLLYEVILSSGFSL